MPDLYIDSYLDKATNQAPINGSGFSHYPRDGQLVARGPGAARDLTRSGPISF